MERESSLGGRLRRLMEEGDSAMSSWGSAWG